MGPGESSAASLRPAEPADLAAIIAIAIATGQDEDWDEVYPAYVGHLMSHGSLLVAERAGRITGFGATLGIGTGPERISMLTDLFVHPAAHGTGTGRAMLAALWADEPRRMTFSSLHANALPLYTSFGTDAWWPLLYLRGGVGQLRMPGGWSVSPADPAHIAALEREWTGIDRGAEHLLWAGWPRGAGVIASLDGVPAAAGTVGGAGPEFGICHLAVSPGRGAGNAGHLTDGGLVAAAVSPSTGARNAGQLTDAGSVAAAVIAVLSWLEPADGRARVCLPAPHPATRPLLAAGWRVEEFDLHMASEFGLIDARRLVPSPALA